MFLGCSTVRQLPISAVLRVRAVVRRAGVPSSGNPGYKATRHHGGGRWNRYQVTQSEIVEARRRT